MLLSKIFSKIVSLLEKNCIWNSPLPSLGGLSLCASVLLMIVQALVLPPLLS